MNKGPNSINSLSGFIGQSRVTNALSVFISAAKGRGEMLDHVILHGHPGLGKTTLANIVANELSVEIKSISSPMLSKVSDIAALLANIKDKTVIFIDEIHRLPANVEEALYSAMDTFVFDIVIGEGISARTIKIDLPEFTLIGATTKLGMISTPLRDRFSIQLGLSLYDNEHLSLIVNKYIESINFSLCQKTVSEIIKRSRGTPRIAIAITKRIRDFSQVKNLCHFQIENSNAIFDILGIDDIGLNFSDRRYLEFIHRCYQDQPVGLSTISMAINEQKDTIECVIEPYLLRIGFIKKTSRGRMITNLGSSHILNSQMFFKEFPNKD